VPGISYLYVLRGKAEDPTHGAEQPGTHATRAHVHAHVVHVLLRLTHGPPRESAMVQLLK
jgi:hypothetical protein